MILKNGHLPAWSLWERNTSEIIFVECHKPTNNSKITQYSMNFGKFLIMWDAIAHNKTVAVITVSVLYNPVFPPSVTFTYSWQTISTVFNATTIPGSCYLTLKVISLHRGIQNWNYEVNSVSANYSELMLWICSRRKKSLISTSIQPPEWLFAVCDMKMQCNGPGRFSQVHVLSYLVLSAQTRMEIFQRLVKNIQRFHTYKCWNTLKPWFHTWQPSALAVTPPSVLFLTWKSALM